MADLTNKIYTDKKCLKDIIEKLNNKNISNDEKIKIYALIGRYILDSSDYSGGFEMQKGSDKVNLGLNTKKIIEYIKRDLRLSKNDKLDEELLMALVNIYHCLDNESYVSNVISERFMNCIFKKIEYHLKNRSFNVLDEFIAFLGLINNDSKIHLQKKSIKKIIHIFLEFNIKEHTNHYYFLHKLFLAFINASNNPVCMNEIYENGKYIISKILNILEKDEFVKAILYKDRIKEIHKLMIQTFCNFLSFKPDFVEIMKELNVHKIVSVESIYNLMPRHCEFIRNTIMDQCPN
jgi:ribonucleotide reductase beta subunit family protein with ferritin-like domain